MRARELAERLMQTEAEDSDGPEVFVVVDGIAYLATEVESVNERTAYIVCTREGE